jgi:hypothetical protein
LSYLCVTLCIFVAKTKNPRKKERKMKEEMINSIVRGINIQAKAFREQVVMKELKEKGLLFDLYSKFSFNILTGISKKDFANIYSQTVILVLLRAGLILPDNTNINDLKTASVSKMV